MSDKVAVGEMPRYKNKKTDTIVERYRINTNEVFQKQGHLRYYPPRYQLRLMPSIKVD